MTERLKAAERREQIVQAAIELFSRKGFRGTTTREIAEAVGISEAALFKYFATKEDLYSAIIEAKARTDEVIALAAAAHPDNRPIAYFWNLANASLFERTNWTEIDSLQGVGPNRGLLSQYRGDAFETVSSASWASSVDWGGIAAELKATVGEEEAVTVPHRRVERLPHYRM